MVKKIFYTVVVVHDEKVSKKEKELRKIQEEELAKENLTEKMFDELYLYYKKELTKELNCEPTSEEIIERIYQNSQQSYNEKFVRNKKENSQE